MTVNVVVEIGGEIGRQITGDAIKILERFKERGRLLIHRLNAHNGAGCPRNILGNLDHSFFNDGDNAQGGKNNQPTGFRRGSKIAVALRQVSPPFPPRGGGNFPCG